MNPYRRQLAIRAALTAPALALWAACSQPEVEPPTLPYDEKADARADLGDALDRARAENKRVLVIFGANWCPDCRSLAAKMAKGSLSQHVAERYVVTKVDVGRFDKNLDLAQELGNPIRKGIPAVAVITSDGRLLKATLGGELSSAKAMGDRKVLEVFESLGSGS
jgi:thiol:disulfide interchange protein